MNMALLMTSQFRNFSNDIHFVGTAACAHLYSQRDRTLEGHILHKRCRYFVLLCITSNRCIELFAHLFALFTDTSCLCMCQP